MQKEVHDVHIHPLSLTHTQTPKPGDEQRGQNQLHLTPRPMCACCKADTHTRIHKHTCTHTHTHTRTTHTSKHTHTQIHTLTLSRTLTHTRSRAHTHTCLSVLRRIFSPMMLSFKALQYKRPLLALQNTATHCNTLQHNFSIRGHKIGLFLYRVPAMSRLPHSVLSVLQCVAVCCSVL